jgi:predicted extracellular nuclease
MATTDLLISEYVEGSSFNKAIEIFNGTGAAVDLAAGAYALQLYSNGAMSPSQTLSLTGTIANGDVFVLSHASADPAILAQTDVQNSLVINFNGDDAVVLRKNGAIVDAFGQIGFDPGTAWGSGLTSTQDHTLRRLPAVLQGDTNGTDAFDASVEWEGFAQNTFNGLGSHSVTMNGAPVVTITATDAAAAEQGQDPATFRISRTGDTTSPLPVSYTVDGTATNGTDYTPNLTGNATIPGGDSFVDVTITPADDGDSEPNETVVLTLVDTADYDLGATTMATATITDNDSAATRISAVQGSGAASPLQGQVVTVEAIVVGDFQNGDADAGRDLGGLYLQEENADGDGNAATSEGIFVYQGSGTSAPDVTIGDKVRITGTVTEFFGETQLGTITAVTVLSSGNVLPTAAQISLPAAAVTLNEDGDYQPDLEAFEGMRVAFPDTLTINEMFQLDRFNEVKLVAGDRPQQFTQANAPSVSGLDAYMQAVGARQITYDDGLNVQNTLIGTLDGFGPTFSTASDIRMGDTVAGLAGVLDYKWAGNSASDSTWRVRAAQNGENTFDKVNDRPAAPDGVSGPLKVASFNVLNYFTTLDIGAATTALGFDPRGADSAAEFDRQTDKLVQSIIGLDADILGLVELENDFLSGAPGNAVEHLVDEINATLGSNVYTWVDPGQRFVDDDAISVGLMYRTDAVSIAPGTTVEILSDADLPALGVNPGVPVFDGDATSRAPIAVSFEDSSSGGVFTVAVNHLKSKGSPGTAGAPDQDQGDGQGAGNQTRLNGVVALDAWLDSDPTGSGDDDFLLLGDFNAYAFEDPITFLSGQGYVDLGRSFGGAGVYSYVFDGQLGTLDYAFASPSLFAQVTGATEWHINADEADALDYNLDFGRDPAIFDGTLPFRTSDHDPVLVGFNLSDDSPPTSIFPGTPGDDNYCGANGGDQAVGFVNDSMTGLAGNDCFAPKGGLDTVFGGPGTDTLDYSATSGVFGAPPAGAVINLASGVSTDPWGNPDYTLELENAIGTPFADWLVGTEAGNNVLTGLGGNDTAVGLGGADTIDLGEGADQGYGYAGNDSIKGGPGNDTLYGMEGADSLEGEADNDLLVGGIDNDTLTGGPGADSLFGETGDDSIDGGKGGDVADGSQGNDTIVLGDGANFAFAGGDNDTVTGGADADVLMGQGGNDVLTSLGGADNVLGGDGNDTLNAGEGADNVLGEGGNDSLDAGGGADVVNGGSGADQMAGGAGSDVFVISSVLSGTAAATPDVITDFQGANTAGSGDQDYLLLQTASSNLGTATFTHLGAGLWQFSDAGTSAFVQILAAGGVPVTALLGPGYADTSDFGIF